MILIGWAMFTVSAYLALGYIGIMLAGVVTILLGLFALEDTPITPEATK